MLTKKAAGRNAVTGEPHTTIDSCGFTRSQFGFCGPEGKYFARRDQPSMVEEWGAIWATMFVIGVAIGVILNAIF